MSASRILLVDDEPNIISLAKLYLTRDGFEVDAVGNGRAALDAVAERQPDLIVLDIMLPEVDGLEVCRQLRAQDNPVMILMLTARDDDVDKILGLEMGADDYLTKPFNPRELVARVKAMLRRAARQQEPGVSGSQDILEFGDLTVDLGAHDVYLKNYPIRLRNQEFDLLVTFMRQPGRVFSREQLLNQAWGYDYVGQTRTVDVHVGHLRKHLAASRMWIETVTGVGYKLIMKA